MAMTEQNRRHLLRAVLLIGFVFLISEALVSGRRTLTLKLEDQSIRRVELLLDDAVQAIVEFERVPNIHELDLPEAQYEIRVFRVGEQMQSRTVVPDKDQTVTFESFRNQSEAN